MASSAEVAQPDPHPLPGPAVIHDKSDLGVKLAWGGAGMTPEAASSPWGGAVASAALPSPSQPQPSPASFRDLMSEDLAKVLDEK